jgi:hypothetical protein
MLFQESTNVVIKLLLGILFSSINFLYAQTIPDWENPDVNGINKEKPHAFTFQVEEKTNNSMLQSLNGIWKFKWSPDPQSRPVDFYAENYLTENWDNILVPGNYSIIDWYGHGPYENYHDRKTGSLIGLYHSALANFAVPYPAPQNNANRCDVRWFSLSPSNSEIFEVTGLQPLNFRAWPYTEDDLENIGHDYQLPKRDFTNLNIDLNIHEVGGDDTWGSKTMENTPIQGINLITLVLLCNILENNSLYKMNHIG